MINLAAEYVAGHVSYESATGSLPGQSNAADVTIYALTQDQMDRYTTCLKKSTAPKGSDKRVADCISLIQPKYSTRTRTDGTFSFSPVYIADATTLLFLSPSGRYLAGLFDMTDDMDIVLKTFDQ